MTVLLTVSETLGGSALGDSLAGGGSGCDHGSTQNSSFSNVTDKPTNAGAQHLYVSHDAVDDPITSLRLFMQTYGVGTGFSYGGADSAANDFTHLKAMGYASGSSKNNADGLSGGYWVDMDADATTANQFDQASFPTLVKIFGDGSGSSTDGIDLASAFTVKANAMIYNAPPETVATSPVDGQIGISGNTVLGDSAHLKTRLYIPAGGIPPSGSGGIVQWEIVFAYSFTS